MALRNTLVSLLEDFCSNYSLLIKNERISCYYQTLITKFPKFNGDNVSWSSMGQVLAFSCQGKGRHSYCIEHQRKISNQNGLTCREY